TRLSFGENHVSMLLSRGKDLVAPGPCLLGKPVTVRLGVRDVPVRRELSIGQDSNGMHVRILAAEQNAVVSAGLHSGDNPAPEALDLVPQRNLLVQQGH